MRNLTAALAALSFVVSGAGLAWGADAQAPMAPGKPAGLTKAQDQGDNTILYIVGLGAIGAGIAILASGNSDNGAPTAPPTTGGSSTTTT